MKKQEQRKQNLQVKKLDEKPIRRKPEIQKQGLNIFDIKIPYLAILILFVATTFIFFGGQLFGDSFFWEDFAEQYFPWQSFAAREFASGILPFWNPFTFSGMPFLADLQTGFFYPLNRLTVLFLDSNGNLSVWGLQFIVILHYIIAQIAMYHLARYWKTSQIGSVIAAVSYGFSFPIVLHGIHPMMVYHFAWFPLIVMFFLQGIKDGNTRSALFAGLILGFTMLAGHPQTTLYIIFFLFALALWYLISNIKQKVEPIKHIQLISAGLIAVIIGAGIFAIQLLPSQELAGLAQRNDYTYEQASEGSLMYGQIFSSVVPKLYGYMDGSGNPELPFFGGPYYFYWDTGYYFGIAALILAIFGFITRIKERKTVFLLAISGFSLLYALGDNFFIWSIFYNLPLFGTFRFPARIIFILVFAFSIVAGFGFDSIFKNIGKISKLIIATSFPLLISLLATAGILGSLTGVPDESSSFVQSNGVTALVFTILAFIPLFLLIRGNTKVLALGSIIIILAFIDLNIAGSSFNSSTKNPADQYKLHPELKKMLTPNQPNEIFRTAMRLYNPSYMAMSRNQGLVDEIMLIEGYNPLILQRVRPLVATTDAMHSLYNVKYEIAINENNQPYFRERESYMPRAWVVHDAIVTDTSKIAELMKNPEIDYSKTVILEEEYNMNLINNDDLSSSAECIQYSNNSMKFKVDAKADGFLVVSEIWYPAWKAYINGTEAKIFAANYCFRAVPIKKGNHIVEMKYESSSFSTGSIITIISLIVAIAGISIISFSKKRKTAE